jgi:single-strand DNA-binding protein
MFNRIILIGNLTKDPELRYSAQGTPIGSFRLAVSSRFRTQEEPETLFIDVVVFGKQAESVSQYLAKGRAVLVEGRLRERRWEYEGQQRSKMEVLAQTVRFLGRREEAPAEGAPPPEEDLGPPPEETTELEPF